ncbi:MAG: leucine-rich repeat protein [Oscillospiraceae bacterium]|nr:leucine-rich repeat protein [Oscillospiraceae bacterium]
MRKKHIAFAMALLMCSTVPVHAEDFSDADFSTAAVEDAESVTLDSTDDTAPVEESSADENVTPMENGDAVSDEDVDVDTFEEAESGDTSDTSTATEVAPDETASAENTAPAETVEGETALETATAEYNVNNACGDNATWIFSDDGTLTISGTGSMYDYQVPYDQYRWYPWGGWDSFSPGTPWFSNRLRIKRIVIENGITSIGNSSFYGCNNLESVSIPDTLQSIGNATFCNCYSLKSVNIPESVTSIGHFTFRACSSLDSVNIPNNVTSIGVGAFAFCTSIRSVVIPASVTSIGNGGRDATGSFYSCTGLTSLTFTPGSKMSVLTIGNEAFSGCTSLSELIIPGNVYEIGYHSFDGCSSLKTLEIQDGVKILGGYAFSGCKAITTVTIPGSIKKVGDGYYTTTGYTLGYTFSDCINLKSVTLEEGVTTISQYVFKGCTSLEAITIPSTLESIDSYSFKNCNKLDHVHIPHGTSYAFYNGKADLPTNPDYYYELDEDGFCPDPDCPMGMGRPVSVTKVTLDKSSASVMVGDRLTLSATVLPTNATDKSIKWTSSNSSFAVVSANGIVTARAIGSAVITAESVSDPTVKASCTVTVTEKKVPKPTVIIKTAFGGRTVQLNCTDSNATIYYNFGSSNITTSCKHVHAGETIFLDKPMTGNSAAMYFKAYSGGKWSELGKWGVLNVQIAKPLIVQSGMASDNNFRVYTQTKDSYIIYTLDGTTPTVSEGTQKLKVTNGKIIWGTSGIVNVPKGKTIKAIAIRCGLVTSDVMAFTNKGTTDPSTPSAPNSTNSWTEVKLNASQIAGTWSYYDFRSSKSYTQSGNYDPNNREWQLDPYITKLVFYSNSYLVYYYSTGSTDMVSYDPITYTHAFGNEYRHFKIYQYGTDYYMFLEFINGDGNNTYVFKKQ